MWAAQASYLFSDWFLERQMITIQDTISFLISYPFLHRAFHAKCKCRIMGEPHGTWVVTFWRVFPSLSWKQEIVTSMGFLKRYLQTMEINIESCSDFEKLTFSPLLNFPSVGEIFPAYSPQRTLGHWAEDPLRVNNLGNDWHQHSNASYKSRESKFIQEDSEVFVPMTLLLIGPSHQTPHTSVF